LRVAKYLNKICRCREVADKAAVKTLGLPSDIGKGERFILFDFEKAICAVDAPRVNIADAYRVNQAEK